MKSVSLKIATALTPILLLAGCASTGASTTNTTLGALSSLAGIGGTTAPASNLGTLAGLGSLVGLGGTPATTTGTVGTATGMSSSLLNTFINQQCQTQLQNNSYWKIASLAMGADRQAQVASNVCGCVTEKAPQSISVTDMANAAINPSARTQIVGTAVARTMQSCYSQFVQ